MKKQKHVEADAPVYTQSQKEYLKFGIRYFQRKYRMTMSEAKGITLIALVITIIILLILAMVSISLVMNSGIINRANNAVTAYNEAQTNELQQLNDIENEMGKYDAGDWWKIKPEELEMLKDHMADEKTYIIALKENENMLIEFALINKNDVEYLVSYKLDADSQEVESYYMPLSDGAISYLKADEEYWKDRVDIENPNENYKKFKWYKSVDGSHFCYAKEYTGPALISSEDFSKEEIYCQSYFNRIVKHSLALIN